MNKRKIDCIFYLVDDYILLYNFKNNKVKKYRFINNLFDGRIIKPKAIINKINHILRCEKISKIFTVQNAIIIYNPSLKYIDKKIIIDVFSECNFRNIKMINSKELLDKNKCYIEINNNYLIVYKDNKYDFIRFNKYLNIKLLIKIIIKDINLDINLIGLNPIIEELSNIDKRIYYYENTDTYFIDKIKKKN